MALDKTREDLWRRAASGDTQAMTSVRTAIENAVSTLVGRERRATTPTVDQVRAARMAAVMANLAACHTQIAAESDYDAEVTAARRGPAEAEVIARAAQGRAMCACDPGLLEAVVARIPAQTNRFLMDAIHNKGPKISIHALVFTQATIMAGKGRSGHPDVAMYAVFYRLWWLAKTESQCDEEHETLPASEVEFIFGLFV